MNRHVEFRSDAEYALRCLGAKPVKWEVAQRRHFLLGSFLEGVSDGIKDFTDEFDAGGLEFKVLGGGGRREDDFALDYDGTSDAEVFGEGELFEGERLVLRFVLALLGGGAVVVFGGITLEVRLFAETVQTAHPRTVVQINKDDGAASTHADTTHPSVEAGLFLGDDLGVLGVEAGELDEGVGGELACGRCGGCAG